MKVLEHGGRIGRTLLFLPCTAEPVWAFAETIALLSEQWHVFQVVFDGHEPAEPVNGRPGWSGRLRLCFGGGSGIMKLIRI